MTRGRPARRQPRRLCAADQASRRASTSSTSSATSRPRRSSCRRETRHLDCYLANILYTDSVFHCTAIGARAGAGRHRHDGDLPRHHARGRWSTIPGVLTIISVNSPRRFDDAMSDGLMAMAEHGPGGLRHAVHPDGRDDAGDAGRRADPAERRGAGRHHPRPAGAPRARQWSMAPSLRMWTCAPARRPSARRRTSRATLAAGQLARRYGLPYRASNPAPATRSTPRRPTNRDVALGLGDGRTPISSITAPAGWRAACTASFEKIVLDVEMLQMMAETISPSAVDDAEEIAGSTHRRGAARRPFLRRAAHAGALRDGLLCAAGLGLAQLRALERRPAQRPRPSGPAIWQERLANFTPPALDPAIASALDDFVAQRKG